MKLQSLMVVGVLMAALGCASEKPDPQVFEEYQSEEITAQAADGLILTGTLHVKNTAAPLIVLFHQLSSNRNEWQPLRLALQEATDATVLAMDLRGHGSSIERGSETLDWRNFTNADYAELPGDVGSVIDYALGRADLSPSSVGLAGSSIGSSGVLMHAATDSRVATVVLLSPGVAYRGLDTTQSMTDFGARPSLLVATTGDSRSADAVLALEALNADAVSVLYTTGSEHGVTMATAHPELVGEFTGWFELNL